MSLRDKTLTAILWSLFERFGIRLLTLFFSVFLARLLTPEDYGVVAMPVVFLSIIACVIDSGFSNALIRKENLNSEDLNTAFFFNIIVGGVCYIILWISSPWIAQFFHTSILESLIRVTGFTTILCASCAIQRVMMIREVDFKVLAKISVVSSVSSGIIAIALALRGYGVWSLVIQGLFGELVRSILLWVAVPWRPHYACSSRSLKYLWNFGSKLMLSSILNVLYENVYPILIGRFYNTALLGNFMKGYSLASMPSLQATDTLQRVTYPVLCKLQGDNGSLASNYRKVLKLTAFFVFPVMIGLSAAAEPIVSILLGDQWIGVVSILQLLSLGMMLYPIHAINLNLLQVKGRSDLFLLLEVIKGIMGGAVLFIVVPKGIIWMAVSVPVLSILALGINTFFTGRLIHVGLLKQIGDLMPICVVSLLMGSVVYFLNSFIELSILQMIIDILVGGILYYLMSFFFLKDEYDETVSIIKSVIKRS